MRSASFLAIAVVCGLAAGCGKAHVEGDQFEVDPKYKEVHELTESMKGVLTALETASGDEAAFAAMFSEPAQAPKNRADFGKHKFSIDSLPKVEGDAAEIEVQIAPTDVKVPGWTAKWKFAKAGKELKLVAAPLDRAAAAAAAAVGARQAGERD